MCSPVPGEPRGAFRAGELFNMGAATALFLGDAADLENVFAAGEVCRAGAVLSTASLGNRCESFCINHNSLQHGHTRLSVHLQHAPSDARRLKLIRSTERTKRLQSVTRANNQDHHGAVT